MIRAVVNVGVLVSAFIAPDGPPGRIIRRFTEGVFEIVVSPEIVAELRRVLTYPKVRRALALTRMDLELMVAEIELLAIPVEPTTVPHVVEADPDDDKYVAAALEGLAEYVVSGDNHLLDVSEYQGVRIVTPRQFLEIVELS